jgi:hypothetical protein
MFLLQIGTFEKNHQLFLIASVEAGALCLLPASLDTQVGEKTRLSAQPCSKVFTELMALLTPGWGLQSQQHYTLSVLKTNMQTKRHIT